MMRYAIATAGLLMLGSTCFSKDAAKEQPNIVLIFTDDMGYGDLSCYGHPNIRTPHIDQMADEGIRFTSFCAAASVCTPSRAALLTGRYPIRNAPNNFGPESKTGLPVSEITIANILKDKGYTNMAIGKWHLGHLPQYLPTSRGFDSYYGLAYSNDMLLPWCPWMTENDRLYLYKDTTRVKEIGHNQENLTVNYTEQAIKFIRDNKNKPFFLYLAHSMPHLPISTSKEFIGKSKGGLYGDVIETIDWSVGKVLDELKKAGLEDNTIVVFTSDNGPWQNLPDRMLQDGVQPWHSGSAGLLNGSKATTYEGGFRVPAIIRWPQQVAKGQVSDQLVTTMDLFTTFAHIAGGEIPNDRTIDGHDIYPLLKGKKMDSEEVLFYLSGTTLQAVREGKWKLRYTESLGYELFNLDLDPSEKYNQAAKHKGLVDKLSVKMKGFAKETKAKIELP